MLRAKAGATLRCIKKGCLHFLRKFEDNIEYLVLEKQSQEILNPKHRVSEIP